MPGQLEPEPIHRDVGVAGDAEHPAARRAGEDVEAVLAEGPVAARGRRLARVAGVGRRRIEMQDLEGQLAAPCRRREPREVAHALEHQPFGHEHDGLRRVDRGEAIGHGPQRRHRVLRSLVDQRGDADGIELDPGAALFGIGARQLGAFAVDHAGQRDAVAAIHVHRFGDADTVDGVERVRFADEAGQRRLDQLVVLGEVNLRRTAGEGDEADAIGR